MDTPTSPAGPTDHEPARRGLGCLWVLGFLVVLVALVVGGTSLFDVVRTRQRTARAQSQVDAAYAAVRPAADGRHQRGDAALTAVLGPARLRSSVVRCSLDEDYAGLTISAWHQLCVLQTIDVYRSDEPVPVLTAQLQKASTATGQDPVELGTPSAAALTQGCGVLRAHTDDAGGPDGWGVAVSRLPAGGFDPLDLDGARGSCLPPRQVYDVQENRVEQLYDPSALDAGHTWVTVERREPVITLDLGCAGLLCDLPTAGVVMPRL